MKNENKKKNNALIFILGVLLMIGLVTADELWQRDATINVTYPTNLNDWISTRNLITNNTIIMNNLNATHIFMQDAYVENNTIWFKAKLVSTGSWINPKQTSDTNPSILSSSSVYPGYDKYYAMDYSNGTGAFFHSNSETDPDHYFKINLSSAQAINEFHYIGRTDNNGAWFMQAGTLAGSDDDVTYTDLVSWSGNGYVMSKEYNYTFTNIHAYKYYKIYKISSGQYFSIGEIKLINTGSQAYIRPKIFVDDNGNIFAQNTTGVAKELT